MEDEEYVPQNSDLRKYLESLNFYETLEDNASNQRICNISSSEATKEKSESSLECIDKDTVEQIQELISARMLFEEDVINIERLLSNFKVVKVGMLRSIFENVSGFIVIVLGLCVYWAIGSYVFFMISIYYAYNAADYLWRKHFNQRRLKDLTKVLLANYNLFKKTLKFIKDSDAILKFEINSANNVTDFNNRYELYKNLKNEFLQAENEIIKILIRATKKLILRFPFYDYIENPKNYLCSKYDQEISQCMDATKLYQIYLLVQSEFLQRLTLSLIPNIKISGSNNHVELYKIIKETSVFLEKLERKFEKKFRYIYLRGICDSENNVNFYSSRKCNITANVNEYKNELISNIQDLSNVFQHLLIKTRTIESTFSDGDKPENVENQLLYIQNELNLCQRNLNDSIIVLKKFSKKITNGDNVSVNEGLIGETMQENHIPPIDLSDLENVAEDEIFEAYFTGENKNEKDDDDFDLEDFVKKKVEVQYSKMVLQELRAKIEEKAKEREIREAKIILKKMGKMEETNTDYDKLSDDISNNCQIKIGENYNVTAADENNSGRDFVPPHVESHDVSCGTFQIPSSDFLADICKAREKLIQSAVNEEYFCNSENEDSD